MLKHIGVGEEFECVVVRIGDRDVIVFASEGFDRREILPVSGKKEMRPFALVFLTHQRPPVAGDALSVFHAGPLEVAGKPSACCNGTQPCQVLTIICILLW